MFEAWLEAAGDGDRTAALDRLGARMLAAKSEYEEVKALDEGLFGDELEAV